MSSLPTHIPASELLGVPPAGRSARERLIVKAIDLFYRNGFHDVGLDRIIDEVGVTKTTFYKHFESKDDLVVAAIRQRDEWESQAWRRAIERVAGADPRDQLLGFFDVLDHWFNDPSFGGCIFINAAAEFPSPNDPVHQAAAVHKRRTRDDVRDLAARAGAADPDKFADRFTLLLEGTLVLRHVHGRNDAAKIAREQAEKLIAEYLPPRVHKSDGAA